MGSTIKWGPQIFASLSTLVSLIPSTYGNSNFVHLLSPFRAGAEGIALVHFGSTVSLQDLRSLFHFWEADLLCGTEIDEKVCSLFSNKYLRFVCS